MICLATTWIVFLEIKNIFEKKKKFSKKINGCWRSWNDSTCWHWSSIESCFFDWQMKNGIQKDFCFQKKKFKLFCPVWRREAFYLSEIVKNEIWISDIQYSLGFPICKKIKLTWQANISGQCVKNNFFLSDQQQKRWKKHSTLLGIFHMKDKRRLQTED